MIVMVGIPGAGKTTFAARFADTFDAPYINQSSITSSYGLDDKQSAGVVDLLLSELLKTRRTILVEADLDTEKSRAVLIKKIIKAGYKPLVVWVQTESVEAKRRATRTTTGSKISTQAFDAALSAFEPPVTREAAIVISGKHTYASQLKVVLKQLASERPEAKPRPERSRPLPRRTLLQ